MIKKFSMVRKLVEEAIDAAQDEATKSGVQTCVCKYQIGIKLCTDEGGNENFHILISGVSPDAVEFKKFVHEYVRDGIMLLTSQIIDIEVITE